MKFSLMKQISTSPEFELELANNVFWVPYNTNATHQLSLDELNYLITLSPEKKRNHINTIIDAVNMFILSDFKEVHDNIHIMENDILWEHHKPGYVSVLSNEGCCASCCTWANYLLSNNFDESGYINLIRSTSGGHVVNYFKTNSWYYILDLQPFVEPYRKFICKQTGKRIDFIKSKFITGILVKTKSLNDYVEFYRRYTSKIVPEHLYLMQKSNVMQPIGFKSLGGEQRIFIPNSLGIRLINSQITLKKIRYQFVDLPRNIPNWI